MDALSDPDYIHYSGLELREAVKRVACGPTWATSRSGPAIHCQLSVESPDIAPGNKLSTWTTYVKLLPGGRFFTLENYDGRLECWSIMTGRCVWSYSEKKHTTYVVDVLNEEKTARFLLPGSSE